MTAATSRPRTTTKQTIGIRFDPAVIAALDEVAEMQSVGRSEAVRDMIARCLVAALAAGAPPRPGPPPPPTPAQRQALQQLIGAANNANQLARALHLARLSGQGREVALANAIAGWERILATVRQIRQEIVSHV